MADPNQDEFIMDTNNSSIVSKRSVERLYHASEAQYFRYFVTKVKRRAPVINRGYWLRMHAIEHTVENFFKEPISKKKVVINLGCGYDPLPWLMLGRRPELCENVKFVDVDYPTLMQRKIETIRNQSVLKELPQGLQFTAAKSGVLCDSMRYAAIGCDLRNLDFLSFVLKDHLKLEPCSIALLCVSEVATAYMGFPGSQSVFEWASRFEDVRFCLLEQHLPAGKDHPFAQTMLKHFNKLRTPLYTVGTMAHMRQRFEQAGWPCEGISIQSLWRLWSDPTFLTAGDRRKLDFVEPFDEWEEYALFASHYFLLVARKGCEITAAIPAQQSASKRGSIVTCEELTTPSTRRRFAAVVPKLADGHTIGLHGGLGKNERLNTLDVFARGEDTARLIAPPIRDGMMCHSITELPDGDCLLVGGRASPDKAFADCWLRSDGVWTRTHSLPQGRYRHCAVTCTDNTGEYGVLVLGGKMDATTICSEILYWQKARGWVCLGTTGSTVIPRFGAALTLQLQSHNSGLLIGGISESGCVCQDVFRWQFKSDSIHFEEVTSTYNAALGGLEQSLYRFGAQIVTWKFGEEGKLLLVGGVANNDLLTRDDEILDLTSLTTHTLTGAYPMLTGFSMQDRTCIGGGATCFSFGTFWNTSYSFQFDMDTDQAPPWHLQEVQDLPSMQSEPKIMPSSQDTSSTAVEVINLRDANHFASILQEGKPVILRGCNIGSCTSKWTADYLKTMIGTRQVVVHSADQVKMDFQAKNFRYETREFDSFIEAVENGGLLYLRALSIAAPSETPTDLATDFPEIASDFQLPSELQYVTAHAHSTPLRISGKTIMWLHYDVLANVLCQIRGKKTLRLFPPQDIVHLGIEPGMSSSSLDVFDERVLDSLKQCRPYEAKLEPGDILFIPSLWLHSAAPTDGMSVAVNIFFRQLESGYAAGRDVYGNRDFAAYERGRRDIAKIAKSLNSLPTDISKAYLERLILELRSSTRTT